MAYIIFSDLGAQRKFRAHVVHIKIAYELQFDGKNSTGTCDEIDAKVTSVKKTGSQDAVVGSVVRLSKPSFCACPKHTKDGSEKIILLGSTVEKFVDRRGYEVNRHIIDEQSTFLRFTHLSSAQNRFLQQAYTWCHG